MTTSLDAVVAATRRHPAVAFAAAAALLCFLVVLSLLIGSHSVSPGTAWRALTAYDPGIPDQDVVRLVRLPRTIAGLVVGLALGAAGAMMQAATRNPLAEPGLLGINAGAAAAVVSGMVWLHLTSPVAAVLAALVGACLAGSAVLILGGAFRPTPSPVRLVLAGAALSTVLGAITSGVVLSYPAAFRDFRNWDAGAIVHRPWSTIAIGCGLAALALVLSMVAARSVDALALGHDLGRALGASPRRTWTLVGLCVVLLAGAATSLAGPISFIGLAAPIAGRILVGNRQAVLVPVSAILAATLLMAADVIGRVVIRPDELPASVVAAAAGAPLFILLARRGRLSGVGT